MDRDLMLMFYGAIMGIVGSIVTSLFTTLFQFWLARREYERRQNEEQNRQLRRVYLPSEEEVIIINSGFTDEEESKSRRKPAQTGYIMLSILLSSVLIYQADDPTLSLAFTASLGILATNRVIRAIKR